MGGIAFFNMSLKQRFYFKALASCVCDYLIMIRLGLNFNRKSKRVFVSGRVVPITSMRF
jgi:hypothetical protein